MSGPQIAIIAHRGASHAYAENTQAAFDAALDECADGIELDLQLSADGIPVVFHDNRLDKLGQPRARVRDLTLSQLQALDVGRWFGPVPARILTLTEVLARYSDRTRLYLEIKHTEHRPQRHLQLAEAVAWEITQFPQACGLSVLSFHWQALAVVKQIAPDTPCVRNLDNRWGALMLRRYLHELSGICINVDRFGPKQLAMLSALDKPLYSYTCDTREQLVHAISLGVTHVITNHPARSRELLHNLSGLIDAVYEVENRPTHNPRQGPI